MPNHDRARPQIGKLLEEVGRQPDPDAVRAPDNRLEVMLNRGASGPRQVYEG
jgi:hypothetical protein